MSEITITEAQEVTVIEIGVVDVVSIDGDFLAYIAQAEAARDAAQGVLAQAEAARDAAAGILGDIDAHLAHLAAELVRTQEMVVEKCAFGE